MTPPRSGLAQRGLLAISGVCFDTKAAKQTIALTSASSTNADINRDASWSSCGVGEVRHEQPIRVQFYLKWRSTRSSGWPPAPWSAVVVRPVVAGVRPCQPSRRINRSTVGLATADTLAPCRWASIFSDPSTVFRVAAAVLHQYRRSRPAPQ